MSKRGKKNPDEKLVVQMMETTGIDIENSLVSQVNGASRIRTAMLRCGKCSDADECQSWLAQNKGSRVASPPDYCLNKELILAAWDG